MRFKGNHSMKVLRAACITLLAYGLSLVLMQPFSLSIATLISSNDRHDFNITDFYNIIADSRAVRALDRDIVILDINEATREDLAYVLQALPDCGPRAVGLDVMFDKPHDDDSELFAAIDSLPDMVMIVDVAGDKAHDAKTFAIADTSFFHTRLAAEGRHFGASNLPTAFAGGVVREFAVDYPLAGTDSTVPSFAVAIAERVSPDAVAKLRERGNHLEVINYPSRTFRSVHWQDLGYEAESLRDKIVLVGAMNDAGDMHATPPQRRMSGIEIHAHALSTVLTGSYLDSVSNFTNMAIAFGLCFILAFIHLSLPVDLKALSLRIIQVFLLYFIILTGYHFFIDRSIVVNFSYTLLMMTFVLFACDIWIGCNGILRRCRNFLAGRKTANHKLTDDYEPAAN